MNEATLNSREQDNQSVVIDRATVDDVEAIIEIKRQGWLTSYPNEALGITTEDIRRRVEGEHGEVIAEAIQRWREGVATEDSASRATFVARVDGGVAGFVAPRMLDGKRRVGALYVSPEVQGQGVGGKLLEKAIEWHGRDEDIYLHVVSYNHRAIDFYKRHSFEVTDTVVSDERAEQNGFKPLPEIEMVLKAKV